uniref:Uncharacterized protein n=1 Tax=Anguilla anguilla TaxID=7936 RepID=A0A0E9XUJ3_ANGAN
MSVLFYKEKITNILKYSFLITQCDHSDSCNIHLLQDFRMLYLKPSV